MPEGLMAAPSDHDVLPCRLMGWGEFENGKLLRAAEDDGFDVMVTTDPRLSGSIFACTMRTTLILLRFRRLATSPDMRRAMPCPTTIAFLPAC
jgi:hypothetical protein